jgi:hypothetical protein
VVKEKPRGANVISRYVRLIVLARCRRKRARQCGAAPHGRTYCPAKRVDAEALFRVPISRAKDNLEEFYHDGLIQSPSDFALEARDKRLEEIARS